MFRRQLCHSRASPGVLGSPSLSLPLRGKRSQNIPMNSTNATVSIRHETEGDQGERVYTRMLDSQLSIKILAISQPSVKILAISQLSAKILAISQLSVNYAESQLTFTSWHVF